MNPPGKSSNVAAKIVLLLALACIVSIFLINSTLSIGAAKSQEREFDNQVPTHLPIRVKLKKEKEKAVKDANNEKWMRDFELEVTNTGDKPIYYLSLLVVMPEITIPNGTDKMGFSFHFGRKENYGFESRAQPDDISIKPGETYVFNLSEIKAQNWERFRQREKKPDAKKLILYFQLLNFGDGTGFWGNEGMAVTHPPDTKSSVDRCDPPTMFNNLGGMIQQVSWRGQSIIFTALDLPAEFLLAKFLSLDASTPMPVMPKSQSGICCTAGCYRSIPYRRDCFCDEVGKDALREATCSDPTASCRAYTIVWTECGEGYCGDTQFVAILSTQ
jgi:hypothetical protein